MNFQGKTVVLTGGASGIGLAAVEGFSASGAKVILGDINVTAGEKAARDFKASFLPLDVTDPGSVTRFRDSAYAQSDNIDVVVNVAGWSKVEHFVNTTPDLWDKLIDLNYTGTLRVVHAFLPKMIADRKSTRLNSSH